METLRRAHVLARLALAWFVLSIGVAVAAPMVQPQTMELVCSSTGSLKLLVKSPDGDVGSAAHNLDCPLCLTPGAPPPVVHSTAMPAQPLSYALWGMAPAQLVTRTSAPLPARGPPLSS